MVAVVAVVAVRLETADKTDIVIVLRWKKVHVCHVVGVPSVSRDAERDGAGCLLCVIVDVICEHQRSGGACLSLRRCFSFLKQRLCPLGVLRR